MSLEPKPPPGRDFWWLSRPARAVRALALRGVAGITRWFASPLEVSGLEHLAGLGGPVILAPNHLSHGDGPLVVSALPRVIRVRLVIAAAADVMFTNPVARIGASLLGGAIPFERHASPRASLRLAQTLLQHNWWLLLFPEGRCSPDGSLQPFKAGIGLLAKSTGALVVPVAIKGTRAILPLDGRWPHRGPASVTFGAPLRYDHHNSEAFALDLQRALAILLDADNQSAASAGR